MPPSTRPFPRHVADASRQGRPYGRWADRLAESFVAACAPLASDAGAQLDPETLKWFPDRAWGGRTYAPVTGRAVEGGADGDEPAEVEYFGWVSFTGGADE